VPIEVTFAETVNLNEPYHVFVQSYGDAELYVASRAPRGFLVARRGPGKDVEFSFRLVGRRRGYERDRLERAPWADTSVGIGSSIAVTRT